MIGAQHVQLRTASQPRPKRGSRTAQLAGARVVRPLQPQIGLSIQLKLKIVGQRLGTRAMTRASARAIPDAVLQAAGLDGEAEPLAGLFAGLALSSGDQ